MHNKGWGFYKLGKYKEALELLEKSWALRPIYIHKIYLHLEEARKACSKQNASAELSDQSTNKPGFGRSVSGINERKVIGAPSGTIYM